MSARIRDHNGWYEVKANPLSKAGVFPYRGSMINAPDPNAIYQVYRPADELRSQATLDSFRLLPIIDEHVMLGHDGKPGYIPAEKKGVHGVIGDAIFFDEADQTLKGNLKVFSGTMDSSINRGKVELSCGYKCKYRYAPGVHNGQAFDYIQYDLLGNHVASVNRGRMGYDVRVLDSLDSITFDMADAVPTTVSKEVIAVVDKVARNAAKAAIHEFKHVVATHNALLAGNAVPVFVALDSSDDDEDENADAGAEMPMGEVVELLQSVMPHLASANKALLDTEDKSDDEDDDCENALDAAGKPMVDANGKPVRVAKTAAKKDDTAMDAAAITAAVEAGIAAALAKQTPPAAAPVAMDAAEIASATDAAVKAALIEAGNRGKLIERLVPFIGAFDSADMDTAGVAKYAAEKLGLPASPGAETVAVQAWLHGRVAPRPVSSFVGMDAGPAERKSSIGEYMQAVKA